MKIKSLKYFLFLFVLFGCNYSNFITKSVKENDNFYNYYIFNRNENNSQNKKLLIFLDGSSLHSTLGIKGKIFPYKSFTFAYPLQKDLPSDFDVLVPERKNTNVGEDFSKNIKKLSEYTLANRVNSAIITIDNYLDSTNYQKIYILGYSEGGLILPKVYNSLKNKSKISKLIAISSGGYSYRQILKSYVQLGLFDSSYVDSALSLLKRSPNSVSKYTFGNPNKKWKDFLDYSPMIEYYKINIPILVLHGDKDINLPVESSRYLKGKFNAFGKTNLEYVEITGADHSYNDDFDYILGIIVKWLNK